MYGRIAFVVTSALLLFTGACQAARAAALDDSLFTTYRNSSNTIYFVVCGSLHGSSGCYGANSMGPFKHVCAILEGRPITNGNVVTHPVYVLDEGTSKIPVVNLYVYSRIAIVNPPDATIQSTFVKVIPLGITGGPKAACSLAGNDDFVYAGTGPGGAVAINKKTYKVAPKSGAPLTSITSDGHGYVSINSADEFGIVDPRGNSLKTGGGNIEMVNTRNAVEF